MNNQRILLEENVNKKRIHHQDDDSFFSFPQKRKAEEEAEGKILSEKPLDGVESVSLIPRPATEEDLKLIYGDKIPPLDNLIYPSNPRKKLRLSDYVGPFAGSGKKLNEKFGADWDEPLAEWFEVQANAFYERAVERNWSENSPDKPGRGFKRAFLRACRAGAFYRVGFDPKSPAQQEAERKEQERENAAWQLEAELERERKKLEFELERKQREKDRKLKKFIIHNPTIYGYLEAMRIIEGRGSKMDLEEVRKHFAEIVNGNGRKLTLPELLAYCEQETKLSGYGWT